MPAPLTGAPAFTMADQLLLSYWLRGFTPNNMLRFYEKLLRLFPHSKLSAGNAVFKIIPIDYAQPAAFEQAFKNPPDIAQVISAAKDFLNADSCYRLETAWDLWQHNPDWSLQPSPVALCCFGPEFEKDLGENLRIEFGIDTHFLPQPGLPGHARMTQANIKSLLRLVHDLDDAFDPERRQLWTESGENFAEKLQNVLASAED